MKFSLLYDQEGHPLAVDVLEDRATDPASTEARINQLRERLGLDRIIPVGGLGRMAEARFREEVEPTGLDAGATTAICQEINRIKHAFRELNKMLEFDERPKFHEVADRAPAYAILCMLAQHACGVVTYATE